MVAETFGEYLRRRRLECGLTRAECYRRAGVSKTYYGALEDGLQTKPSDAVVLSLAGVLGANADRMFCLVGRVPPDVLEVIKGDRDVLVELVRMVGLMGVRSRDILLVHARRVLNQQRCEDARIEELG